MGTTIGEKIKERRLELRMTQDELARKVGYRSRSSINKIELSRELPLKKIEKIAKALDTDPSYLMGWREKIDRERFELGRETMSQVLSDRDKRTLAYYFELTDADKEVVAAMIDRLRLRGD